ncbi:ATP-grasp domain-containing protein [Labilibacter sediminis]|nr:ATP-grasp domain-containing protein [Labilibacter sediminis]
MKKILVLGCGNAQTDFIKFCSKMNLEVHSCSYREEGRGIAVSDYFVKIDIMDSDSINKYVVNNSIDLVYSTGSDIAMPVISKVSYKNHLPHFVSEETAVVCNDKSLLRDRIKKLDEFSVKFKKVGSINELEDWNLFPAIIKPVDSQGQRGVFLCENEKQLQAAFEKSVLYSKKRKVIIEEYIEGYEISVNVYVKDGEVVLFFVSERNSFSEYPGGIIKNHVYPLKREVKMPKLKKMIQLLTKELKIENGPAYFQIKVDGSGNPKVIEVTPRLDGCHIWRLIHEVYGLNLFKITLDHLLYNKFEYSVFANLSEKHNDQRELFFFTCPPNTKLNRSNFSVDPNAKYLEWYYEDGETVREINGFQEKIGYQIV